MKNKGMEYNHCSLVLNYGTHIVFPFPLPSPAHLTLLILPHRSFVNNPK